MFCHYRKAVSFAAHHLKCITTTTIIHTAHTCKLTYTHTHTHTHLVDISQRFIPLLDQLGGKLRPFLRVHPHHSPEEEDEVWTVVDSLGIEHNLVKLASLCKALNHLQIGEGYEMLHHELRRVACKAMH